MYMHQLNGANCFNYVGCCQLIKQFYKLTEMSSAEQLVYTITVNLLKGYLWLSQLSLYVTSCFSATVHLSQTLYA